MNIMLHIAEIVEEVCFRAMQRLQATQKRRKAFSSGGATEAEKLLQSIGIMEVNGNEVEPIVVPEGTLECSTFDFSIYPDENSGTPDLLKHHQSHLERLGVSFGKGSYAMYDLLLVNDMYNFSTAATTYSGGIDGGVAPFGLMSRSASSQCRVGYKHFQSTEQKLAYYKSADKLASTYISHIQRVPSLLLELLSMHKCINRLPHLQDRLPIYTPEGARPGLIAYL